MAILRINKFSGGLADSLYSGIQGSFANGSFGLDIHTDPGLLQSQFKFTKDSGSTATDLIVCGFRGSDGHTYYGGDSGNIYKRTSAGSWSVVRTEASRICGMYEYNGQFFWAISTALKRMANTGDWSAGITTVVTWTGAEIDSSWHNMKIGPTGDLFVTAGQYLTKVNSSFSVTAQALDLPPKWVIKCINVFADYILIGANYNGENTSAIFKYDGFGDTFLTPTYLPVPSIDFIFVAGTTVLVGSGYNGKVYQYLLNDFADLKRIPGSYTASATGAFYPNAVDYFNDLFLIGVSNGSGNPSNQGVYSWGSPNKNYPKVLNFDYPISTANQTGVIVGCIVTDGANLFVSWKDGSTYGVDKLDYTTRTASATFNTTLIGGGKPAKTFKRFILNFEPLAASCSITMKYKTNRQSSWTAFTDTQAGAYATQGDTSAIFDQVLRAESLELQVIMTVSGTSTPKINMIEIEYDTDTSAG